MGVFATMPMWCRRLVCRMVTLPVVLTRLCRINKVKGRFPPATHQGDDDDEISCQRTHGLMRVRRRGGNECRAQRARVWRLRDV